MRCSALRTSSAVPQSTVLAEAMGFAVAPVAQSRAGSQVTHIWAQAVLTPVSVAAVGRARGKMLTVCSVNTRAVKARRFPFPQYCRVSAHRQNSSTCPPTEGSSHGKRQLMCHSRTHHPVCSTHAGRPGSRQGATPCFIELEGQPFLWHCCSHIQRAKQNQPWGWAGWFLTILQRRELKPYKPSCAFCDHPLLALSKHPRVQAKLCQKLWSSSRMTEITSKEPLAQDSVWREGRQAPAPGCWAELTVKGVLTFQVL